MDRPKNLVAEGLCFPWAYQYVSENPDAVLYHGYVRMPESKDPPFVHGWVIHDGVVKDWQTMVAGFGGPFSGRGYPKATWVYLWKPQLTVRFSAEQAHAMLLRQNHYGPWGPFESWGQKIENGE